jgi:Mor family transcriptional regulator
MLKMSSSDKHKNKTSTLSTEAEIIKELDKGEERINLAKEYGVGHAMIYNIRKNREKIECFVKDTDSSRNERQSLKSG